MSLLSRYHHQTAKALFLLLIVFQIGYSSEFYLTAGTGFFLQNYFKGSGPHEPDNINLRTDKVWADNRFSGFGLKGSLLNLKGSNFGAEFGVQYNHSKFPEQDVELSYFFYSGSLFQPSFEVKSYSLQLTALFSTLPDKGLMSNSLIPYAGVGLSYSIASISDVNLEPEYGVGGESDGKGFGYLFKAGAKYLMHENYIIDAEIFYHAASIHVEKFRSYNIDGIDGTFSSLAIMMLFGYSF
ncbi:MAG: hypothetical protein JXR46_16990 [Calditrichaceae bacterium]|nr:hypothetical protein [Calditrichaceae bacterium]MBN2710745.1 hypothetical protein [Calditrichaceae bacterium]RQV95697.1 MAG: hypothetical protein EH224_06685 [Calditrichota bacterium]